MDKKKREQQIRKLISREYKVYQEEERFKSLKRFCVEKNRIPTQKEKFEGIKIGYFYYNLLEGKQYKEHRNGWLKELKDISPVIKNVIESRAK